MIFISSERAYAISY